MEVDHFEEQTVHTTVLQNDVAVKQYAYRVIRFQEELRGRTSEIQNRSSATVCPDVTISHFGWTHTHS